MNGHKQDYIIEYITLTYVHCFLTVINFIANKKLPPNIKRDYTWIFTLYKSHSSISLPFFYPSINPWKQLYNWSKQTNNLYKCQKENFPLSHSVQSTLLINRWYINKFTQVYKHVILPWTWFPDLHNFPLLTQWVRTCFASAQYREIWFYRFKSVC